MKFPSIFKTTESSTTATATSAFPRPPYSPRIFSIRANSYNTKPKVSTIKSNSVAFVQENDETLAVDHLGSSFSFHENVEVDNEIVKGLLRSSDRFFFEPGETNSILEEAKTPNTIGNDLTFEEGTEIVAMDSCDPFLDFRISMEEMILAHGLKSWERLEDLLTCYLKVNVKSNHGYIIGAFVDLLANISISCVDDNSCSCSSSAYHHHHEGSFTSPLSFCSLRSSFYSPSIEVGEDLVVNSHVCEIKSVECSSSSFSCNASSSSS